jgi:hypothetical protein
MTKALLFAALFLPALNLAAQTAEANRAAKPRPSAHQIITFDVPGGTGTYPAGINDAGEITGTYRTTAPNSGFIRSSTGAVTTFAVAGCVGVEAEAINAGGEVAGYCYDASNVDHGFVREPSGATTIFDPPGSTFTVVYAINNSGGVTGYYSDASNGCGFCGFTRDRMGNITSFSAPNAADTRALWISADGSVAGYFYAEGEEYSTVFIRDSSGAFTTFLPPGAGTGRSQGAYPAAINANDEVVGSYVSDDYRVHGFSRAKDGVITILNDPNAYKGPDQYFGTSPTAVNSNGEITGNSTHPSGDFSGSFGFTVDSSLNYTSFNVQGAGYPGTDPAGINAGGTITGTYFDAVLVARGFIRY